ncbi:MAG: hypothetical protein WBE76_28545 [Terracidiphilus sp.]
MTPLQPPDPIREAKTFLASRIAEEADREGIPLSEIERKMLYFSKTGWTLADMHEVSAEFIRDWDRAAYEKRIARLIRRLRSRIRAAGKEEYETWKRSIEDLRDGDQYVFALIAAAQPKGEVTRLIITALVVIGVMLLALFLASRET